MSEATRRTAAKDPAMKATNLFAVSQLLPIFGSQHIIVEDQLTA